MSETSKCPECGAQLPASAPRGLCPACLLKRGLETNTVGYTAEAAGARWTPPGVEELASRFPELEIVGFIGRGGMGAVYKARQKALERVVALKILPPEMGNDAAFAERFAREAQAMARLNHPHIVTIHEFGERAGWYYFVMEYVDGMSLRGLLDSGHVSPKEALAIVPQICEALQYAHEQGIVHRDIKPENILLNKQGQVKIADFGLAKLMGQSPISNLPSEISNPKSQISNPRSQISNSILGTPQYMAPEQLERPAEVDHRADIYSLGVVFYQMLTGELPVGRFAPPSRKVQIDVRLDEIVLRALEKEPEKRYQQVSEVKTMVETIVGAGSTASPPATEIALSRRRYGWIRKSIWKVAIALLVLTLIRVFVLELFHVTGDAVTPEVPLGSRVLVYKLAQTCSPGDIVLYHNRQSENRLARVMEDGPVNGKLRVQRGVHGEPFDLAMADVVGRVILNTRTGKTIPEKPSTGPAWSNPSPPEVSYRTALLGKYQQVKSEAALRQAKARIDQQESAAKSGGLRTSDIQVAKDKVDALEAELERFSVAWHRFELAVSRHKAGTIANAEYEKEKHEVDNAEVGLRVAQAAVEREAGRASFGPVVERVVPANNETPYPWFDIDTGRPIISLRGDDQDAADFCAAIGADSRGLSTANETDFGSVPLEEQQWDTMNPAQLIEQLKSAKADSIPCEQPLPATYGFTTRAGGLGILQVLGAAQQPDGIRIRYKLVQATATQPAQSGPASSDRPDQASARLRLADAETMLTRVQALEKQGAASQAEVRKAKLKRDVASAEVAGNPLAAADAKMQAAEEELHEYEKLQNAGAASTREVEDARLKYQSAKAQHDALQKSAATSPAKITIEAHRDTVRITQDGQTVEARYIEMTPPNISLTHPASGSPEDAGQTVAGLPPVVVKTQPASGARDVAPGVTEIRVTFSKDMADRSWSWSTAWQDSTPEIIGQPRYEPDHRTAVVKVKLEPGTTYGYWLNSNNFHNFTDKAGQPAVPYLLIFQTQQTATSKE